MKTEWNLDVIYKGIEDPAYEADIEALKKTNEELEACAKTQGKVSEKELTEKLLQLMEKREALFSKLFQYVSLRREANNQDAAMIGQLNRLQKLWADSAALMTTVKKILAGLSDVDALAAESELIQAYSCLLKDMKEEAKYMLSEELEAMASAMNMTGGEAWSNLRDYLTSVLKLDYKGEEKTLSQIRNMAYDPDPEVRRAAYEAEVASYEKIQDSVAFALNNIKNQVIMLSAKRGYESVLEMTLKEAKLSRKTLDAMMEAIEESLPVFRTYLKKKAAMLGYTNGLPWFELFAPMGKADTTYSLEQAKELLSDCYESFSGNLAGMIREAFDDEWIDFYPRKGKAGGAFCMGLYELKQSRILTNYDGYFGSIRTLGHELGHAFHNRQLESERILNQDYSMPLAETASTFNEVLLGNYVLETAKGEERLNMIQNDLQDQTQVIMDIYSRYLFETEVFERCQNEFLLADTLNEMMIGAQKKAYGDGLDENYLNPGMWICKGHYYSPGLSFYNFPYAFGNLFALGLYAMYKKEESSFADRYCRMLKATTTRTAEEVGEMMGIDFTDKAFWKAGLDEIAREVEVFVQEF